MPQEHAAFLRVRENRMVLRTPIVSKETFRENIRKTRMFSANCGFSANYVNLSHFRNSTSHAVAVNTYPRCYVFSSRRGYFSPTDDSIGTVRSKKPLDFVIDSLFSANYSPCHPQIATFPQIAFSAFLNQQRNYFAYRENTHKFSE